MQTTSADLQALSSHGRRLATKSICAFLRTSGTTGYRKRGPSDLPAPVDTIAPSSSTLRSARFLCWANKIGVSTDVNGWIQWRLNSSYAPFRGLLVSHAAAQSRAEQAASSMMAMPNTPPTSTASADAPHIGSSSSGEGDPLVQYVVVRRDLTDALQWPLGAVVAQACHAAVDALGLAMDRNVEEARRYLAEGSNMRTVVLQVSGEGELLKLRDRLVQNHIEHKLWQEEPEKIPTALASVPIRKSVGKVFKGLKLLS